MLDKPMTRSETDSNALPRGRLTRRYETNYARQRDVRNVTYRRDGNKGVPPLYFVHYDVQSK